MSYRDPDYQHKYRIEHKKEAREYNRRYQPEYYAAHKEKILAYSREYYTTQRRRVLAYRHAVLSRYKTMKGCIHCNKRDGLLEFHHPNKYIYGAVSDIIHYTWAKVKEEIAVCAVVCRNCHRRIHSKKEGVKEID